ncbi:MAG: hypothetical protein AVDCRST_MAG32-2147 [uncultured Nocardioides sp.]|uniref:Mycothiol-dependent maleylpyruvate isomerase metal-binding domain-containing protein n=1 Tax=uncultured Nocardioides sp. TaxID=198441 RepID=A0A6J4NHN7_9ACTN|nr:MAG: hypothetical protein AVDCRST_MAG32-2147 [uncultured Nocardioides sp.]
MPLPPETYVDHLRHESALFRTAALAADPAARVPGCPEWDATDLLWHLAEVQWHWAEAVEKRPAKPDETAMPPRPATREDVLAFFDDSQRRLVAALEAAQPGDEAWNWSSDQTVGFILRRQAHEALVHRVDAEQTAGAVSPVDPVLAADGVHEVLDVMLGGMPDWGHWEPLPHVLRVDCTDTGDQFWVRLGVFSGTDPDSGTTYADEEDLHVVAAPDDAETQPDVVVDGPAAALDLWLWDRGDDAEISVAGDREVFERFRAIAGTPID